MTSEEHVLSGFSKLARVELLRLCIDAAPAGIAMFDREMRYLAVNRRYRELLGLGDRPLLGRSHYEVFPEIPARWRAIHRRCLDGAVEQSDADPFIRADGSVEWHRWSIHPWHEDAGAIGGIVLFDEIVTEQVRLEAERYQMADAFDHAAIGMIIVDAESGAIAAANAAYAAMRGLPGARLRGSPVLDAYPPEERQRVADLVAAAEATGAAAFKSLHRRADGKTFPVQVHVSGIRRSADGTAYRVGSVIDTSESEVTEARLRQAMKMEAVGHLTGGVAHDFNNLLAVVIGNAEMALERLGPGAKGPGRLVGEIMAAGLRGAALTQRLLAFSRQQTLNPRPLDVNGLVRDMEPMLRRTLGEMIEIRTALAADLWETRADANQLENCLVNLAVNARDAMPAGGSLGIETANVVVDEGHAAARAGELLPGPYVVVAVSDTGSGMSPEVRQHAFEPFYTTKEQGKGTGLGLSMVYGFVKQSGGDVTLDSEEGAGTTISLYLPRSGAATAAAAPQDPLAVALGHGETILLVEDDGEVRAALVRMLSALRYRVLEAADARAGLALVQPATTIDMIVTDVIMPGGMSGWDLAQQVWRDHPDLPILFVTGYTDDALLQQAISDDRVHALHKPFRQRDFAAAVRRGLAARGPKDGGRAAT